MTWPYRFVPIIYGAITIATAIALEWFAAGHAVLGITVGALLAVGWVVCLYCWWRLQKGAKNG